MTRPDISSIVREFVRLKLLHERCTLLTSRLKLPREAVPLFDDRVTRLLGLTKLHTRFRRFIPQRRDEVLRPRGQILHTLRALVLRLLFSVLRHDNLQSPARGVSWRPTCGHEKSPHQEVEASSLARRLRVVVLRQASSVHVARPHHGRFQLP